MEDYTPNLGEASDSVRVLLAVGGNVGDVESRIAEVVRRLSLDSNVELSRRFRSQPMYETSQNAFINAVIKVFTRDSPERLLVKLKGWEKELGRKPTFRNGPREIDLDILDYGGQLISLPELEIPHPRLGERPFVLLPLRDVEPSYRHPRTGEALTSLIGKLPEDHGTVPLDS